MAAVLASDLNVWTAYGSTCTPALPFAVVHVLGFNAAIREPHRDVSEDLDRVSNALQPARSARHNNLNHMRGLFTFVNGLIAKAPVIRGLALAMTPGTNMKTSFSGMWLTFLCACAVGRFFTHKSFNTEIGKPC